MKISNLLLWICLIILFQNSYSQTDLNRTIKLQAEKAVKSAFQGEYDTLIKHTHPRVIEIVGGKEAMLNILEAQMAEF